MSPFRLALCTGDTERTLHSQIMFGSNGPRFRQFKLLRALDKVPMREYARESIYYKNALRFFVLFLWRQIMPMPISFPAMVPQEITPQDI